MEASGRYPGLRHEGPVDEPWGQRILYIFAPSGVLVQLVQELSQSECPADGSWRLHGTPGDVDGTMEQGGPLPFPFEGRRARALSERHAAGRSLMRLLLAPISRREFPSKWFSPGVASGIPPGLTGRMRWLSILLIVGALTSGCYRHTYNLSKEDPAPEPAVQQWHDHFLLGVIDADDPVNLDEACPNGVYRVQDQITVVQALLTLVTLYIYAPKQEKVICES